MRAAAVSDFSGPYCEYFDARRLGSVSPVHTARIVKRLETPGLVAGSNRTSPSTSVTARLIFFSRTFGSSRTRTVPCGESTDFDIFDVGS